MKNKYVNSMLVIYVVICFILDIHTTKLNVENSFVLLTRHRLQHIWYVAFSSSQYRFTNVLFHFDPLLTIYWHFLCLLYTLIITYVFVLPASIQYKRGIILVHIFVNINMVKKIYKRKKGRFQIKKELNNDKNINK